MRTEFPKAVRKLFEKMEVAILSPIFVPEAIWIQSIINMVAHSWHVGLRVWEMGMTDKQVIHWARNNLCRAIKDAVNPQTGRKYTHVLWLDCDLAFERDLAVELAKSFIHEGVDAVSAVYYSRTGEPLPSIFIKEDCPGGPLSHYTLLQFPEGLFEITGGFGFGAVMMRMDVLTRVPEPWFQFQGGGEDLFFCVKAREHGVRLWVDGAIQMAHVGVPPLVTRQAYQKYMEENKEKFADRIKVKLTMQGGNKDG
jgi:hypothetical protein